MSSHPGATAATRITDGAPPDPRRPARHGVRVLYWFSRFEFALKENRYLKKHEVGAPAEASWQEFADKHGKDHKLTPAAEALIAANPLRQVVRATDLDFVPVVFDDHPSDLVKVVRLANTVRNNLFPGGKHRSESWDNPVRMRQLLSIVIRVLDELADHAGIDGDYRRWY